MLESGLRLLVCDAGTVDRIPPLTGALAMKVLLWIVAIIFLIGLAVVLGIGGLIF